MKHHIFLLLCLLSHALIAEVDFTKEVRPILSKYCFHCHGPDGEDREKKLRLDMADGPEGAYRIRKKKAAVLPGNPLKSHVYLRMITDDEDDIMPPLETKKEMKTEEIAIIKK